MIHVVLTSLQEGFLHIWKRERGPLLGFECSKVETKICVALALCNLQVLSSEVLI